ncbi:hypothetical protein KBD49_11365 [Myxococcota bacterium]|nr:hypothetical protein [Myxococcota bacterium]
MRPRSLWILWTPALMSVACGPEPAGIAPTRPGSGPLVVWDAEARPLPEIPFPNDSATRLDPTSPTGRRVNVALVGSTRLENKIREKANELDGFGTFAPLWVSFSDDLDVQDFARRHRDNRDLSDDAVYLVDIDPASPEFGRPMPLDAGQGNVPLGLEWPWQYWDFDPHADSPQLLFETHDEDQNGNGVLDPYEDIDFDGVLDRPNTFSGRDPGPRGIDDVIPFWERQTRTLFLWPVAPLRELGRYAVVLTDRLKDPRGQPVRSPFPYVNPLDQTEALAPLGDILKRPEYGGLTLDQVAFAWTFTTQTVTPELQAIRQGLYGTGPLDWLRESFPPALEPRPVQDPDTDGTPPERPYMLPTDVLLPLIGILGPLLTYPPEVVAALQEDTAHVDYWVVGEFTTPWFLVDRDGLATEAYPADENESFGIDLRKGTAWVGPQRATFLCSVPKATGQHRPPFPVMVYGHGFSGAPFEVFGFAGRMARLGWALCGLDAPGHGLALPSDEDIDWNGLVESLAGDLYLQTFYKSFSIGRIRDLDNDGVRSSFDNGGDFWCADISHTRDMVRQAVVDHMQFIRMIREFGTGTSQPWKADANGDGVANDLAGDFNGDGIVDFGTPANPDVPIWGQSMGAFIAEIAAAMDPAVTAATPVSGGGGLISAGMRSTNPGVPEGVWMPMMGPMVVFTPKDDGTTEIAWLINHLHREYHPPLKAGEDRPEGRPHYYPIARVSSLLPGDTVVVRNLTNGEVRRAFRSPVKEGPATTDCAEDAACKADRTFCQVDPDQRNLPACDRWRGFRVSLPCDALTAVEKRRVLGLQDGDTRPVPVSCPPGSWTVPTDAEGKPTGPANCDTPPAGAAAPDAKRSLLFGDQVRIEIYSGWVEDPAKATPKEVVDTFRIPVTFEGAIFPEGAPLVAIGQGLGRPRNTPEFRRLIGIAGALVERGDPIAYARTFPKRLDCGCGYDELSCPGGTCPNPQVNMVIYHAVGDPNVSIGASMALARGARILQYEGDFPTPNDLLLQAHVGEAVESYRRHLSTRWTLADWAADRPFLKDPRWPDEFTKDLAVDPTAPLPLHADPDNVDEGLDPFGEPAVPGYVRATRWTRDGYQGLRFPYTYPLGAHGVEPSNPSRQFNINNYFENQAAVYLTTGGRTLLESPCLADSTCPQLPDEIRRR